MKHRPKVLQPPPPPPPPLARGLSLAPLVTATHAQHLACSVSHTLINVRAACAGNKLSAIENLGVTEVRTTPDILLCD